MSFLFVHFFLKKNLDFLENLCYNVFAVKNISEVFTVEEKRNFFGVRNSQLDLHYTKREVRHEMLHFKKGCKTIIKSKNKLYQIRHLQNSFKKILKRKGKGPRSNLLNVWLNLNYLHKQKMVKTLKDNLNDVKFIIYSTFLRNKICSYCISLKNYGKRIIMNFHLTCTFRRNTKLQKVFCLRSHYT